jgi:rod shape-determining protein MreC
VQTPDGTGFGIVQPHLGSGAERGLLEIRGVPFRSPMKAGQLVVSYGQGGTYPRGIPVGTVIRELQTPERWARTYLLQPSVSLGDVGAVFVLLKPRAVAGVDSVWTSVTSSDSAARRVAVAGDSLARDILLREAAARRAALDSARGDSAARDTTSLVPGAPATAVPPVPGAVRPASPADTAQAPGAGAPGGDAAAAPRPVRPTVPGGAGTGAGAAATRAAETVGDSAARAAARARARAAARAAAARADSAEAGAPPRPAPRPTVPPPATPRTGTPR